VPNPLISTTPGVASTFEAEIRSALGSPSDRELSYQDIYDAVDRGLLEFSKFQPRTMRVQLTTEVDKFIYDVSDFDPPDEIILAILATSLRGAPAIGGLTVSSEPSTSTDDYLSLYAAEVANDASESFLENQGGQFALVGAIEPGSTISAYAYVAHKRENFPLRYLEELRLITRAYAGQTLLALRSKFAQVNFGVSSFSVNNSILQSLVKEWEDSFRTRVSRVPFSPV
jgi:hypothetical protein